MGSLTPDLTFLHTVNKKNLTKRLNLRKRKNRYDIFNYNFYKIVQNGFLKIAKNKKRYLIVDSNKSISDNKIKVINKINKFL